MAEDTIKSFLVELGFKLDEQSLKKFREGILNATKAVLGFAAAIEAAAVAVAIGVERMAANLESLYFATQRSNTSARNLAAFDRAAQDFGLTAGEAQSAVEGLATALRRDPGNEFLLDTVLERIGLSARDANGKLRDTTDLTIDLGKAFRKINSEMGGQQFLSEQWASQLGLSDKQLQTLQRPEFQSEAVGLRKQMAGMDAATKAANEFEKKVRALDTRFQQIGVKLGTALMDALGPQLEQAAKWIDSHSDEISKTIKTMADVIFSVAGKITEIGDVIFKIFKGLYEIGHWIGDKFMALLPDSAKAKLGKWINEGLDSLGIHDDVDDLIGNQGKVSAAPSGGSNAAGASAGDSKGSSVSWFKSMTDLMGGAFSGTSRASFLLERMGLSSERAADIIKSLQGRSGLDPRRHGAHGEFGIGQWDAAAQSAFKDWSGGRDIHDSSLDDQLAFLTHDLKNQESKVGNLLLAAKNVEQVNRSMNLYYRDRDRSYAGGGSSAKAGTTVNVAPQTTIYVSGDNPTATGRAVGDQQHRVTSQVLRDTLPLVK